MENRFIDLFAGIGGFHYAAKRNGLEFVFGSEIDDDAKTIYELNHKVKISGDITKINEKEIPNFDWMFGGFPCQAFSVGGKRRGFEDTRGTLFFDVARIANEKKPKFILLENVKGLLSHDSGNTWKTILLTLDQIGYYTTKEPLLISPHDIGVPQRRERIFIPCIRKDLIKSQDDWIINIKRKSTEINLIEKWESNAYDSKLELSDYHKGVIKAWKDFKDKFKLENGSFSIWVDYWGKNENEIKNEPEWKKGTIMKNIEFYNKNKVELDKWIKKHNLFSYYPTHRKFEWSVGSDIPFDKVILQFRPSGLRAIKPNLHPTITTIINQTAIIPSQMRKISIEEVKELQSFPKKMKMFDNYGKSIKQLGNAVNVSVVEKIISEMKKYE